MNSANIDNLLDSVRTTPNNLLGKTKNNFEKSVEFYFVDI